MGKKKKATSPKTNSSNQPTVKKLTDRNDQSFFPWIFLLLAITVVIFFPMLKNGFTNWDDDFYVINNSLLHGPDWTGIFSKPVSANYHPFTILSLALNYAISGTEAWSYLLLNLILHLINVILVFKFIYIISEKKTGIAFLTALLFAIHPMHVESVAWVSERKDVLYTLFFLLSLIQYWKYLQKGKQKNLWICFLFFVFSLLSKPAAIILPLVLLLLDYWKQRSFNKKWIVEKIPFFLLAGLFAFITLKFQSETAITGLEVHPLWARLFFACYVVMIYFFRFFIPYPLSAYYPYPPNDNLGFVVYISPLFVLALLTVTWLLRKNKFFVFGILFFVINLLLVLQLITIGSTLISERYTYVPYIGLGFILATYLDSSIKEKLLKWFIPSIITLVFGIITFQRTQVWKDSGTLWTDVIDRFPNAAVPRNQRAIYYGQVAINETDHARANGLLQTALEDCNTALKLKPDYAVALENRQRINLKLDRNQEALADADSLIKLEPDNFMAFYTKGAVYYRLNEFDKAISSLEKCVSLKTDFDQVLNLLGTIYMNKYKKYQEALTHFDRAININPTGVYFVNRSSCYYNLGDTVKAKNDAMMALQKGVAIPDTLRKFLNIKQ